jgi:bifunctional hydroxylase/dehydrase
MALRYDMGPDSPEPVGRMLPTKHLRGSGADAPMRGLLRDGRGAFLSCGDDEKNVNLAGRWDSRVNVRTISWPTDLADPLTQHTDFLVRPDGYVAWTSHAVEPLCAALERWYGPGN